MVSVVIFCLAVSFFSCLALYLILTDKEFKQNKTVVYAVLEQADTAALRKPSFAVNRKASPFHYQ